MKKILALIAILAFTTLGQASVVLHLSGPTSVADPFTAGALKSYTLSLQATGVGEKITAVDVRFQGPLWQEALYKSGFGAHYVPTPMNNMAADGFPPEYIVADTHFLLTSAQAVWPTGKAANEDLSEAYLPRDSYDVWHSQGTYLKSDPMGLADAVQAQTVALVQLVIPASYAISSVSWMSGSVATNQMQNPQVIPQFALPEPATMMLLLGGSLFGLLRRRS